MVSGSAPAVWRGGGGRRACETGGDGESARWPRRGLTTSRTVGAPQGKGAGESQGGATCRYRATVRRLPMASGDRGTGKGEPVRQGRPRVRGERGGLGTDDS